VGTRFYALAQNGPGVHPASCTVSTGSFHGVKRPGRGVYYPTSSSAEVKERIEPYLCTSFGLYGELHLLYEIYIAGSTFP
jgi:hypothetical protein